MSQPSRTAAWPVLAILLPCTITALHLGRNEGTPPCASALAVVRQRDIDTDIDATARRLAADAAALDLTTSDQVSGAR